LNPVQYLIMDPSLDMGEGKARAQAAHASVEGLRISAKEPWGNPWDSTIVNRWYQGGHYAKIVLAADDLLTALSVHRDSRHQVRLSLTRAARSSSPLTAPLSASEILDKDMPHVRETFSVFKLYPSKEEPPVEQKMSLREKFFGF
jgi:peptidyl-tRNA hydrolase